MPAWLNDAVFYEIYPQSFQDTNGDGIGDLNGIVKRLDYIKGLGCNALWINPCFDSPFKDAGYDVRDYKKVAPRYGTNEDLVRLFQEAHERGIRVLLDLVPGHTSEEHPWFRESQKAKTNQYSNRYIWTSHCFQRAKGFPFIGGESERSGTYVLNFFKCQPALNYGFYKVEEPWQLPMDHPDCIATREAMKDVMRFWMDQGCDGFRVDMAYSLVKNDDDQKTGTSAIWKEVRAMLDQEYPEAALIAEWGKPHLAVLAGYHSDFFLSTKHGGYESLLRDYENGEDHSFFKKDGHGDITRFLEDYLPKYETTKDLGYCSFITCNHDTIRPRFNLDESELKLAYAFLFTLPGVPFLYYGDEIGMRYLDLPTKEGGYFRTGSRTPMQWNSGRNLGFSDGNPEDLYLPVDESTDAPTVEAQEQEAGSLLHTVRDLLALRHQEPDLHALPNLEIVYAEKNQFPFIYRRGALTIAVNPSDQEVSAPLCADGALLYAIGEGTLADGTLTMKPQSFLIFK